MMTSDKALPLIIGHRGASRDAPENTLEAFRLAWSQGADGIEADFRLTGDGKIVCIHDATTVRTTTADNIVKNSTLSELRRLDAGRWKDESWSGSVIPTLDEVLAAIPTGTWFNIEIKSGAEIIAPLKKILHSSDISPERVRLLAFSSELIAELSQQLPDWHSCWLCDYRYTSRNGLWQPSRSDILETVNRIGAYGLASADRAILDRDFVQALRNDNKEIHVWTVDRLAAAQRLCELGVTSIMTNKPGWLRRQLLQTEGCP